MNIQQVSTFDANLTWKSHIHELYQKRSKTVGVLSKLRYYVNIDILKCFIIL